MLTLESIKAEQTKLAQMIAALEAKSKIAARYPLTVEFPDLNEGEIYVGSVISACGTKSHHIILLPGDVEMTWPKAMEWAQSIGGDLPDRMEQALLFAHFKDQFEERYYWSNAKHATEDAWAWSQDFGNGTQNYGRKGNSSRARAVRRLIIQ